MKLLLDENLPHQFRHEILGHDCSTVAYMGWAGIENGDLLSRAAAAGFEAFVTKDANIQYERNLVNLPIAVIVLHASSNKIASIQPLVPKLLAALENLQPCQVTHVT